MHPFNPITRRAALAGSGLVATVAVLRAPAGAQNDGFRVIRAREAGYAGTLPGPVLRVRRGEEVKVRLTNELSTETAIHWHGVRAPNAMDGTSLVQKSVTPGASFDYRFAPPDAGTYWYHPPVRTGQNRTLQGVLIVDEANPVEVDRDVALMIDVKGEPTANGFASVDIPVTANERVRLRIINASDDFIRVRVEGHAAAVMAIDGQPAEPFAPRESTVTLSPGNRVDLFLDATMEPGSVAPITLQNDPEVVIARLVYAKTERARAEPRGAAKPLPQNGLPARMDFAGARRAELVLDGKVNALPAKPLFSSPRGRTVVLALANRTQAPQVLHIHGHHVRLLDALDDGWKPFWLDTILCVPRVTTRVAFVADNPGKWLLNTREIGAEASALAWFEVT